MTNSLLWQTFSALSNLERKHLGLWLRSPYFCRKQEPARLFDYLLNCSAKGKLPELADAGRFVHNGTTLPGIPSLRLVMSELLAQTEQFLAHREFFSHSGDVQLCLAGLYRKRGLEKHFRQRLHAAKASWASQPCRHAEYFDAQASIEYEWYQHLSAGRRTEALNWQQLSDQTDTAYIARKLRQACMALSHQAVYKTSYKFGMLDAVIDHVRASAPLQQIPAIAMYFFCYQFLSESEGEQYFRRFKSLLFESLEQLPTDEQRNLHLLAINFCIRKINRLESAYSREALDFYQSGLNAGLFLENGQLSHFAYNNIAAIALKVGDADWAERFIHDYVPFLEKKHRDAAFHLNLARVEYMRRNLKSALLHLQQADYKDLINNLTAKTLQLKIYFEAGEYDALDAHLHSMQMFIRRQRVIGYHKANYLNIVRYTRRLMQLHPEGRAAFRQQIEAEPVLTEKEWLLEQIGKS